MIPVERFIEFYYISILFLYIRITRKQNVNRNGATIFISDDGGGGENNEWIIVRTYMKKQLKN